MAWNFSRGLDRKHVLFRQALRTLNPFPNCGLRYSANGSERSLRPGCLNSSHECFVRGKV